MRLPRRSARARNRSAVLSRQRNAMFMNLGTFFRKETKVSRSVLLIGMLVGLCSFAYCFQNGLSTLHYDAKAHLVIARRVLDSVSPGYIQMGAHWLPLIHLLYLPFVWLDAQYRSPLFPCLISVISFALSGWLTCRLAMRLTGSAVAGGFAGVLLLANQNLQFLQSAPLTEPVFMVLFLLALDAWLRWRAQAAERVPWLAAVWAALGALCRYEGWLLLGGIVAWTAYDAWSGQVLRKRAIRAIAAYAGVFVLPALAHFGYIYLRIGDSFFSRVARGNPAPYETFKRPFLAILYHFGELAQVAAIIPLLIGLAGVVWCLWASRERRRCAPYFLLWLPSLANIAALYWGLIYRVRYSCLLLPAIAVFGSLIFARADAARRVMIVSCLIVFALPWVSWYLPHEWDYHFVYPGPGRLWLPAAALLLLLTALAVRRYRWPLLILALCGMLMPVFDGEVRPVLAEAREHVSVEPEQQEILTYLTRHYDGTGILIDVGRLAPLMYDSCLPMKEFVCQHDDPGIWSSVVAAPRSRAGWLCAEKGDEIWGLLQGDPDWADGYSLAVQTENYLLYQRNPEPPGLRPRARLHQ